MRRLKLFFGNDGEVTALYAFGLLLALYGRSNDRWDFAIAGLCIVGIGLVLAPISGGGGNG